MKDTEILKIREQLGLTQQQLAEQLGVAMKTVSRWEKGETKKIPEAAQQKLLSLAERGKTLIYTTEAKLFLRLQRIHRGSISPWLLLPHITTTSISARDAFVDRGVKIFNHTNSLSKVNIKLADLPKLAETGPIVLQGTAGSGKTFLIRWIADSQGYDAEHNTTYYLGTKIPIIFPLIQYNEAPTKDAVKRFGHPILAAIVDYHNYSGTGLDQEFFLQACKRGEVIFLLDALDEIPNETRRHEVLKDLETLILQYEKCAFILTTRPDKYRTPKDSFLNEIKNKVVCELSPLTSEEQQELVKKLYISLAQDTDIEKRSLEECVNFLENVHYKYPKKGEFLRNPLHLVLAALLILEGSPPGTTDVQLEHQSLELNIIRWPEARSIGKSLQSSVNFPGTDISKNQIWSKLSKWALEIIEKERPIDTAEIEQWVLNMPVEPEGETPEMRAKRIAGLMLERLPFIMRLEGKDKFTINEPHLTHLAAHRLTELRNRSSWLFNDSNYKVWKRVEVWKRAILITSIIHRQPELVNHDLKEFVEQYEPDELDSMFDTAESMSMIIKDLLRRPGVLDWEPRKDFYAFLMNIFLKTDYDETAKFFFRIFQFIQASSEDDGEESGDEKQNRILLKKVFQQLTQSNGEVNYDKTWRAYALQYAIGECSGKETEIKLLEFLDKLEKESRKLARETHEWKEFEKFKRRTIFVLLLMQLHFSNKLTKYHLSTATISILLKIVENKENYEVGVVGRACDVLDKLKEEEYLDPKLKAHLREIFIKIDSAVATLKVVEEFETALNEKRIALTPQELVNQVSHELEVQKFQAYTSETVKYLKNFFREAKNFYAEENQGRDIEISKILFNCAIDRKQPALLRAVSFLYLAELPPEIEKSIPNFLTDLENSFKEKPRPQEDELSVGAVQIYDYNQACLNRHYARRSQETDSNDMLNLREFHQISYAQIDE
ncbi:MAG: NACHT domain-containing protein [Nostoc sp.]|uniref:NACHT domain-containing protein n=1 Tax=Nostoc sp. TaxID=1180 RepID=UPI002FF8A9E6